MYEILQEQKKRFSDELIEFARLLSDTRIAAETAATSEYRFLLPPGAGPIQITAELRFRRLFADQMAQKQWDTPDTIMAVEEATVTLLPRWTIYLPAVR